MRCFPHAMASSSYWLPMQCIRHPDNRYLTTWEWESMFHFYILCADALSQSFQTRVVPYISVSCVLFHVFFLPLCISVFVHQSDINETVKPIIKSAELLQLTHNETVQVITRDTV